MERSLLSLLFSKNKKKFKVSYGLRRVIKVLGKLLWKRRLRVPLLKGYVDSPGSLSMSDHLCKSLKAPGFNTVSYLVYCKIIRNRRLHFNERGVFFPFNF